MVSPTVGHIVLVPFSDLSASKLRPALVLAKAGRGDWICVQITSNPYSDSKAIEIDEHDFSTGSLNRVSYARPGKLFTAHEILFRKSVGRLSEQKLKEVISGVIALVQGGA